MGFYCYFMSMKLTPTAVQATAFVILLLGGFFILKNVLGQNTLNEFSTYGGAVAAIVGVILIFRADNIAARFNELQAKPEIAFSLSNPPTPGTLHANKFRDSVKVMNLTSAPVKNIVVRFKLGRNNAYSKWVSCFSLRANEEQELSWLRYPDTIQAAYHDLEEKKYYQFTYQDSHGITESITEQQYKIFLQEAIANRDVNNIHLRDKFDQFITTQLPLNGGNMDNVMKGYRRFIASLIF